MSADQSRHHQMFPVLDAVQIETAKRFASGPERRFAPGETVFEVGERHAPAWLVLEGSIDVVRRDGLAREAAIVTMARGSSRARSASWRGANRLPPDVPAPRALRRFPSMRPMCGR
jgi:thioredoxin reductase (NADPH)